MGTLTLNARTDLTYEEIYEGYANGKSRLPKFIKQIEAGLLPLAETTGIDIKRRRTEGGNAETIGNVGQTDSTVVAKLISASRWTSLIAGYSGPGSGFVTPPSFNLQTVKVRQVIKEPFDLIDQVAGINFAIQVGGAATETNPLTGRETKIQEKGTGIRIREIDTRAPAGSTADIDVRDFFPNDRIGGGGATGEVHGVDQGIPELIRAESEGRAVGNSTATYDLSGGDDNLFTFDFGESANVDVVFAKAVLKAQEVGEAGATVEPLGEDRNHPLRAFHRSIQARPERFSAKARYRRFVPFTGGFVPVGDGLQADRVTLASACSRSAIRSSESSIPHESRTSESVIPISSRSSGVRSQKDMIAGNSISVSTPPRLGAM